MKGFGEGKSHGVKAGRVLLVFVAHDLMDREVTALANGKAPLLAFCHLGGSFNLVAWFSWEKRGRCFNFVGGSFPVVPSCVQASHVSAVGHVNPKLIHLKQTHFPAGLAHAQTLCKSLTKPALFLIKCSSHLKLGTKHQPDYYPMLKVRKNCTFLKVRMRAALFAIPALFPCFSSGPDLQPVLYSHAPAWNLQK